MADTLKQRVARTLKYALYGLVVVALAWSLSRSNSGPSEGSAAADFNLPVVGEGAAANENATAGPKQTFGLADAKGKPLLIEVFASWCGSCRRAAPTLSSAYADRKDGKVEFIGISVDDSPAAAARVKHDWQIPYKVLFDERGDFSRRYKIRVLPTFVLIDARGQVRHVSTGAPSRRKVEEWVRELGEG